MGRRKKKKNFNFILIVLAVAGAVWIAADFWFNVYRHPQKETTPQPEAEQQSAKETVAAAKELAVAAGFKAETYKDDRYGFEFQYPVPVKNDSQCTKLEKTSDGVSLGLFSLIVVVPKGAFIDFINSELEGMEIDSRTDLAVAGLAATKIDYTTAGMGFNGSTVFFEKDGKVFEFGLLANEAFAKCGGVDDYEDQVYQAVIETFKFAP